MSTMKESRVARPSERDIARLTLPKPLAVAHAHPVIISGRLFCTLLLGLLVTSSALASPGPGAPTPPAPPRPAPSASSGPAGRLVPLERSAQIRTAPSASTSGGIVSPPPAVSSQGGPGQPPPVERDLPGSAQDEGDHDRADEPSVGISEFIKSKDILVIPQDQTVRGDRYYLGKGIQVSGTLDGDLHALGESTKIIGTVTEDVNALAQDLDVIGEVGDDARLLGRDVQVSGRIGGDLMAMGRGVSVLPGASVHGRTVAFGQVVALSGRFDQDVCAAGGEIVFAGQAAKNVDVESDVLRFEPGAHIKGNLTYKTRQEFDAAQGAEVRKIVEGKVVFAPRQAKKEGGISWKWECWTFVSAFLVGCLFIALGRGAIRPIIDALQKEPLWSFGFGLMGHVFAPFAAVVLVVITCSLALPLGLLVLTAWGVLFYVAKLAVAASLGDAVLRALGRTRSPYLALLIGMIVIWILFMVPILGLFLYFIIVPILGIGAIVFGLRAYSLGRTGAQALPSPAGATAVPI